MKLVLRPSSASAIVPRLQPIVARHNFATQHGLRNNSATSKRKAVTPFNDDGYVPWSELSAGEKASRATQQTFNFGMVVVGLVLTGGVGYFLYQDVFSPDSKTAYFNRAVDRIKKHPECVALLGDSKKIIAHGEETMNKWRRARPIASTLNTDAQGNQHLLMHFYIEGPLNNGIVNMHLTKRANHDDFEYKYLYVDIRGHPRIYLENADFKSSSGGGKKIKVFGVNWN
ncbi:import inner membrane translocase subunit tim-21, mitochondrial [Hypomontagnella monticulosa]|nr:import inner membrane translocase subunit tim-21, mitochondrial [Hypomontagnella monticulosa]